MLWFSGLFATQSYSLEVAAQFFTSALKGTSRNMNNTRELVESALQQESALHKMLIKLEQVETRLGNLEILH
jgi:hypothetical protein